MVEKAPPIPSVKRSNDPLSQVPAGKQYNNLRSMLEILKRDFPEKYAGLANQVGRVRGWVSEIDSGTGRSDDDIRDDIAQHIIGADLLMSRYNVDEETAKQLISGGNEGGMNFSDLDRGDSSGSHGNTPGVDDVEPMRILASPSLSWFKDRKTGRYYARYALPHTNSYVLFEATDEQMKALFGDRPPAAIATDINALIRREDYHHGGSVAELEGEGTWEDEIERTTALALDQRSLPDWIKKDPKAMALLWLAVDEDRSDEWFYEQLSKLPSFKQRYPGLEKLTGMGLTVSEAVQDFAEFETQAKRLHAAAGFSPDAITPGIVGNLLGRGYSIKAVAESYQVWKRMGDHAPALEAFNKVLQAQGKPPLSGTQMYRFLMGTAEQELYDIYEASAVAEAASAVGLGGVFSGNDALSVALGTEGELTVDQAYQKFSNVAAQALRFRHELDVAQYGLEIDDLIDVAFGRKPRSGKGVADIGEALGRITLAAEGARQARINPFTGFTPDGRPQQRSLGTLRQQS